MDEEHREQSPSRRDNVVDRRTGLDRRALQDEQRRAAGMEEALDRRRGVGRRLSDFTKSAEAGEMTREQFLFLQAMDAFKRANGKCYPTWTDVLEVIRKLGYRKTMPSELGIGNAEDWKEAPDAPSAVKAPRWEEHGRGEDDR